MHQAAPLAFHRPAYTVCDTKRRTLPPTPLLLSAQAHLLCLLLPDDASTSLGCRAKKSPRWQPCKPPSFQCRSHPDQHWGPRWSCGVKKKKKKEDSSSEIVFSSSQLLMIRQTQDHLESDPESVAHFRLRRPLLILILQTHADLVLIAQHRSAHMHRERKRQKNGEETHKG